MSIMSDASRSWVPVYNPATSSTEWFSIEASSQLKSITLQVKEPIKVAVFTCPISSSRTETKGTVLSNDAKEMLNSARARRPFYHVTSEIAASGAWVIVSGNRSAIWLSISLIVPEWWPRILGNWFTLSVRALGATLARPGAPPSEELGSAESGWIPGNRLRPLYSSQVPPRTPGLVSPQLSSVVAPKTPPMTWNVPLRMPNTVRTLVTRDDRIVPGLVHEMAMFGPGLFRRFDPESVNTPSALRRIPEIVPWILAMNAGFDSFECPARPTSRPRIKWPLSRFKH